ncbi:PAS domain-containing protein [Hymenobacter sp. BT186]|uniref:histidine kinase n=1 Tax=Hymenobacter telluris TaxID=2816474 RepID=A0A939F151_9BACT|nr:ATP-binding protein [Hymenobacter telluris]MBO0359528.1 PAS domain-containing protein [Hymenobacter telluris]MBW3375554.1 PAS domain-containing protein [Hymenobacter norwichensis]
MSASASPTPSDLTRENEELRHRLQEAEDLIHAVRTGAVDALAIQSPDGPRIFTLQGADESYRTLIEQMSEGAMLLNQDGTILYCNACLASWLRRGLEEVIGQSFAVFIPRGFQVYWAALLAQGWAGHGKGEVPLQTKGGALRPLALSLQVLTFSEAPVVAVIATDLSAQREISNIQALVAEQNVVIDRKNEEIRFQESARMVVERAAAEANRMLEGIPQIAWTANPYGQTTYFNRRWFDFTGQPDQLLWKYRWEDYQHPEDAEQAGELWESCLRTGDAFEAEFRLRDRAENYRWMLSRAFPSRNEQGDIIQWIGTCTDIHEHKLDLERIDLAQQQLQLKNAQLTRVNIDLDNFIYTASHDLRAPITNIEGLLQALLTELPDGGADVQPIMNMMQDSVDRFKRTIDHLTTITKLQKENDQPTASVDLAYLIEEVRLDLQPQIQEANARVSVDVREFPMISFAEKNLRSIVYNLLSNAVKYRSPNRDLHIRIRCRPAGEYALLTVQDNGLGIPATSNEKLFGMFERLHDHVEGSGMGLYIVKKIVENAGGSIEVVSQLDVGSTFSVYLGR